MGDSISTNSGGPLATSDQYGPGVSSGRSMVADNNSSQPPLPFPYPLLPRVYQALTYTQAAQRHILSQPHPTQTLIQRSTYIPQTIRRAVPAPPIVQHQLTSLAAVFTHRANRTTPWNPLQSDSGLPRNEAECLVYVDTMLLSFTEVRECTDKDRLPFPNRWTIPAQEDRFFYDENDMVDRLWDILDIALTLHLFGPSALSIYKPTTIAEIVKDEKMPFSERIEKICNVFRLSKYRCDMVIGNNSLEDFVACISKKESDVDSNSRCNSKRSDNLQSLKKQLEATRTDASNETSVVSGGSTEIVVDATAGIPGNNHSSVFSSVTGSNIFVTTATPISTFISANLVSGSLVKRAGPESETKGKANEAGRRDAATEGSRHTGDLTVARTTFTTGDLTTGVSLYPRDRVFEDFQHPDNLVLPKYSYPANATPGSKRIKLSYSNDSDPLDDTYTTGTQVKLLETTPFTDQNVDIAHGAWDKHQSELQSSNEDHNTTNNSDSVDNVGSSHHENATVDDDDGLAYLAAFNAAFPLPGEVLSQPTVLRGNSMPYGITDGPALEHGYTNGPGATETHQSLSNTDNNTSFVYASQDVEVRSYGRSN